MVLLLNLKQTFEIPINVIYIDTILNIHHLEIINKIIKNLFWDLGQIIINHGKVINLLKF